MNCIKGRELLLALKRAEWLPPFDEEGLRIVLQEIETIHTKLDTILENYGEDFPDPVKVTVLYYHECLRRNHRYVNSYVGHRLSRIRQLRWEAGMVLPRKFGEEILSDREKEYFMGYNNILSEYNQAVGVDLTCDVEPPKDLLIEVVVVRSCGEVMTEDGPVSLEKGSRCFLRRSQIEHFVRDGAVRMVDNEDGV